MAAQDVSEYTDRYIWYFDILNVFPWKNIIKQLKMEEPENKGRFPFLLPDS